MLAYLLIVVFSIILCFMNFASEIVHGNISHIKNGRTPNAGACIFPIIPFIPLLFICITWVINKFHPNAGFYAVSIIFIIISIAWFFKYTKLKKELQSLV